MCGIVGFGGVPMGPEEAGAALRRMADRIVHRGPDDAGYMFDGQVGLGMRRLSIIDLAGGHQPISNEDGSVHVVFNGEIYNYQELARDLERAGHRFGTRSDTETLVHLWEEHGPAMLGRLRGMFAFAIRDARRGTLFIARDRLGIKPLFYRPLGDGLAFASELKALRALGTGDWEIDESAIARYLALGYVPDPLCVYRGVLKLAPGHSLLWDREGGIRVQRYWAPPAEEDASIDEQTAVREVRRLLGEAVGYRLVADVPVGAFLSGGLDSSAVVAEMSRQMDRPVQTFSIGFKEPEFNEAPDAAAVAEALGTDHTDLIVSPDVDELIEWLPGAFDEPFADSSAIPTLLVSGLAASRLKVVLSGDGGDELFGGYTRYRAHMARSYRIPSAVRSVLGFAARRLPQSARGRARLLEISRGFEGRYVGMLADPLATGDGGVARPDLARAAGSWDDLLHPWFDEGKKLSDASKLLRVDLLTYLPGDILTKVDRMSMAVSLEARVPLLDHELVEFACRIPSALKIQGGVGKAIFRSAVRDLVPERVLSKRKQGFGVPLRHWFRRELRGQIDHLTSKDARVTRFVEPRAVERIVREHVEGRRDHSPLIWKLLMLELWLGMPSSPPAIPELHRTLDASSRSASYKARGSINALAS